MKPAKDSPVGAIHVMRASRWHERLLGLMFRANLAPDHALLLSPCASVHTAFMRFAIDVVYLDGDWRVLTVHASMAPWRTSWGPRGTRHTLELTAGSASKYGWQAGECLQALLCGGSGA